jgi:fumarylacetoacetase
MTLPTIVLDETHDPTRRSWVTSANEDGADFPLQNLPFGRIRPPRGEGPWRVGVAIGDRVLDLGAAAAAGLIDRVPQGVVEACTATDLGPFMALERRHRIALRRRLHGLLVDGSPGAERAASSLLALADVEVGLPVSIGDYTDFYASVFHATNVGRMMRPDNPLLPNYKHVPIGYHGRASSIVPSGTRIRRPSGQTRPDGADRPVFGPTQRLDYELEVGLFVGPGNPLGQPVPLAEAEDHAVGLCLLNDWSARDVQAWEYQPLGPFLAKSFATTISPWVVTLDALEPFRVAPFERPAGDPAPLPYLDHPLHRTRGGIDVRLDVWLQSARMRDEGLEPIRLSESGLRDMYWTFAQMIAHHTSNGCNLRPGDLLASGTVSGAEKDARGCLLELTWRGQDPIALPTGEVRRFLEDGDEVTMTARCARAGMVGLGFGRCVGRIVRGN